MRPQTLAPATMFVLALVLGRALGADAVAPPVGSPAAIAALPAAPEKALVLNYCSVCHDIDWVVRSGGTLAGWTDRIQRMIRGGAPVPREQIPAIAAYLAKALPPRNAPQATP